MPPVNRWALAGLIFALSCGAEPKTPPSTKSDPAVAIKARGDSLGLPGTWTAPPGDRLAHSIAGFPKTLCSAVFITGLDPADAAEFVGYFTGPYADRKQVKDTVIDRATSTVRLTTLWGDPSGAEVRQSGLRRVANRCRLRVVHTVDRDLEPPAGRNDPVANNPDKIPGCRFADRPGRRVGGDRLTAMKFTTKGWPGTRVY